MKKKMIDPYIDNRHFILKNKLGITNAEKLKKTESDIVTLKIAEVYAGSSEKVPKYNPSSDYLLALHKYLFKDLYGFAGEYRTIHIEKAERALAFLSVEYSEPEEISDKVENVFKTIRETDFYSLDNEEKIDYVTNILVDLWKTHPFREGNTRTSLVFLKCFLKSYNIEFDAELFKMHGTYQYTRDALVAASFEAEDLNVKRDYRYIRGIVNEIMEESLENNLTAK